MIADIRRVSYADHARAAADRAFGPDDAGRVAAEACRLEPLQKIQVATDQLIRHAEGLAGGRPFDFPVSFDTNAQQVLDHIDRHVAVLRCAADAAQAMRDDVAGQLSGLGKAMTKHAKDDEPKLTPTGEPHPLQEGGYDADADPGLPSNISDVEAMKEGKTTKAQAEALAVADTADGETHSTPPDGPTPAEEEAGVDDDAKAARAKPGPKPKGEKK